MDFEAIKKCLKPYFWRLLFLILGLVVAVLFLTLGAAKTFVLLFCGGIGYLAGLIGDKGVDFSRWTQRFKNRW